jgi:mannose-6-phosphate isomerase
MSLYPLKFTPIYKEKVWGGRTLEKIGRTLPGDADTQIGESWELVDLSTTSVSGGGGGAERSVVNNGPHTGKSLHELIATYGKDLIGDLPLTDDGNFPLLVKFLDANEHLSVQVHPSQEYADTHDDAFLKSECWYIVDSRPDGCIFKGIKEGTTPEQFRKAIEDGTVEELMIKFDVKPGDCHYLPSGTCHALGAGVLVAEVQTPSDTTFRVYDWGREGRELHVEQAMQCIDFGPCDVDADKRSHVGGMFTTVTRLVTCEYFILERVKMSEGYEQEIPYDQPAVWMIVEGDGQIILADGSSTPFTKGETLLIPARMDGAKVKLNRDTTWLETTFPQAGGQQLA